MLPDRVSNPGPLTYESGALSIALRGPLQMEADSYLRTVTDISCHSLRNLNRLERLKRLSLSIDYKILRAKFLFILLG